MGNCKTMTLTTRRIVFGTSLLVSILSKSVMSLVVNDASNDNFWNRRTALAKMAFVPAVMIPSLTLTPSPSFASISNPSVTEDITTLVIGDPDTAASAGLQFQDVEIGGKAYPVVKSVQSGSIAASRGVQEGMVLLGKDSASKASKDNVEFRIRNGPYPFVLQFITPQKDGEGIKDQTNDNQIDEGPLLDPYDRMVSKAVKQPSSCRTVAKAKRGDTVEISYEARISSRNGPVYDSTAWRGGKSVKFVLGKGTAIPGVDIGVNGMCVGEVRELDIPTALGYGKFGSQVFDIPGDKRLWWRVELVDLTKGGSQKEWRFK